MLPADTREAQFIGKRYTCTLHHGALLQVSHEVTTTGGAKCSVTPPRHNRNCVVVPGVVCGADWGSGCMPQFRAWGPISAGFAGTILTNWANNG